MNPIEKLQVPGYEGRGLAVNQRETVRITDVDGCQVGDLFAISQKDTNEYLCRAHSRSVNRRLFPKVGEQFVTNRWRPILTFLHDTSPGIHDTLYKACDSGLYDLRAGAKGHPNCHDNFLKVVETLGLDFGFVPGPVNLFQNTPVGADGEILRGSAPTKAGDYVEVRAEMPIYLILTSCSYDLDDVFICGTSTPLLIEVFP
jgi:uncharacterized protein YcgI (DUF1989 family)